MKLDTIIIVNHVDGLKSRVVENYSQENIFNAISYLLKVDVGNLEIIKENSIEMLVGVKELYPSIHNKIANAMYKKEFYNVLEIQFGQM